MQSNHIATAYLRGAGTQRWVPTTPGRGLRFVGGAAKIDNDRDMPYALRLPVQVEIRSEYLDRLPSWVAACGLNKVQATLVNADGDDPRVIGPGPLYEVTDGSQDRVARRRRRPASAVAEVVEAPGAWGADLDSLELSEDS